METILYSATTNGFYSRELHGNNIPKDAVEITAEKHAELLQGQAEGKKIVPSPLNIPSLQNTPQPTVEQIEKAKIALVQKHLDDTAREYRYDDIKTACTYAEEPAVEKFQEEGKAFRRWRSLVWAECYDILEDVQNGEREIPTDGELLLELPPFVPPTT